MRYLLISRTLFISLTAITVSAQQNFFIKNKKTGKLKKLKQKTYLGFDIMTTDNSKQKSYFGRIVQITDSTIVLEEYIKSSLRNTIVPTIWIIRTQDIKSFKNYLIDNDDFNTIAGMLIIGGSLGLVATPIVWLADGKEAGKDGAVFTTTLLAADGILLLPQLIGKRRHMTKWEFVKR
jgi:predicted KAP-like P-loop ATPase